MVCAFHEGGQKPLKRATEHTWGGIPYPGICCQNNQSYDPFICLWLPSAESISWWSWSDFWLHARLLPINWWKNKTYHHESVIKNDKHIPDIHGHKKHKLMICLIFSFKKIDTYICVHMHRNTFNNLNLNILFRV